MLFDIIFDDTTGTKSNKQMADALAPYFQHRKDDADFWQWLYEEPIEATDGEIGLHPTSGKEIYTYMEDSVMYYQVVDTILVVDTDGSLTAVYDVDDIPGCTLYEPQFG